MTLRDELRSALNRTCAENSSNTPDFILAEFLIGCLNAFDVATNERNAWYDPKLRAGAAQETPAVPGDRWIKHADQAGHCCDINASYPGQHRGGCPSETSAAPMCGFCQLIPCICVSAPKTPVARCSHGVPIDPAIPCERCGESPLTTCAKCGEVVNVIGVNPGGWIDVEHHKCHVNYP